MTAPHSPSARTSRWPGRASAAVLLTALASSSCQGLIGGVELTEGSPGPSAGGAAGAPGAQMVFPPLLPAPSVTPPSNPNRPEVPGGGAVLEPTPAGSPDAGAVPSSDAGPLPPPVPAPRPVVVEPPALLELVGFNGGGPRLGTCQDGIVIGVRPTANPNTDGFGQRLTFVEPICASIALQPAGAAPAPPEARLTLLREDVLLSWDATEPMLGPPTTEVPDERVLWVPQPEALCPEVAPALVGLSGAYDPAADDGSVTATIRSLVLECAPLLVAANGSDVAAAAEGHLLISRADSFAAPGTANYRSACEGGSVLSQLLIHSGFWLDGFVLGCSTLRGGDAAAP